MSEWYIPSKEDDDASAQADRSMFLLLVRGDHAPLAEESQNSGHTSVTEDVTLSVERTPQSDAQTLVSDAEDTRGRS